MGGGARAAVDPPLQDRGDEQRQRDDRAGGERRVAAPDQEAQQADAARVLRARVRPAQQRGIPHRPEELRPELRRLLPRVLPAAD